MKTINLLFAVVLLLSVVGCGKEEDKVVDHSPKIKTYTLAHVSGTPITYTYTYNADGNVVSKLTEQGIGSYYYYNTNKIVQIDSYNGDTLFVYTMNSQRYVVSAIDQDKNNYTYTYNSNFNSISENGTTSTWLDGNRILSNSNANVYTFYPDHLNSIGNKNKGQNYFGVDSKNLIESIQYFGTNTTITYSYEFDAKKRVTKRNNGTLVETYTYY